MPQNYIDTLIDGNGDVYYPKTKEKAITDDEGINLANKLTGFGVLIDCNCTFSVNNNTYLLEPIKLTADIPQMFSVRFKAPNDYVANATFTLKGEVYNPALVSGDDPVPSGAFSANSVVTLDFYRDTV